MNKIIIEITKPEEEFKRYAVSAIIYEDGKPNYGGASSLNDLLIEIKKRCKLLSNH